jgi:hypothetical protein
MLKKLMAWFVANPTVSFETTLTLPGKDSNSEKTLKRGNLAA